MKNYSDQSAPNPSSSSNMNKINNKMEKLSLMHKRRIMKPRDYQKQIYEKAKDQNSIIYLETGKGKTFISIMIMADFLGIDIKSKEIKKISKSKKNVKHEPENPQGP